MERDPGVRVAIFTVPVAALFVGTAIDTTGTHEFVDTVRVDPVPRVVGPADDLFNVSGDVGMAETQRFQPIQLGKLGRDQT